MSASKTGATQHIPKLSESFKTFRTFYMITQHVFFQNALEQDFLIISEGYSEIDFPYSK